MIAADTNTLVRLLTQDDRKQAARANELFASEEIWIAKTVLLECGWALGSVYGFPADQVASALRLLTRLPNVRVEDDAAVNTAHGLVEKGVEFADALHLASRPTGATFVSFDERFVRRARRAGVADIVSV